MTRIKSKKILKLMEVARELFWKHGLKRVTVEEICEKARVSKMTFYRHFPNKTELAKEVYKKVIDEGTRKFRSIMLDETTTVVEKMEGILMLKLEGTNDISREFLNDFYNDPEEGLSLFVEETTRKVWEEIIRDFKLAQQKGWLRKDFKAEAIYIMSSKMGEMVNDETLLRMYPNPQELVMEIARFFTWGIAPRNEKENQK
jgi:AcrR family transcriptional regulator